MPPHRAVAASSTRDRLWWIYAARDSLPAVRPVELAEGRRAEDRAAGTEGARVGLGHQEERDRTAQRAEQVNGEEPGPAEQLPDHLGEPFGLTVDPTGPIGSTTLVAASGNLDPATNPNVRNSAAGGIGITLASGVEIQRVNAGITGTGSTTAGISGSGITTATIGG